MDAGTGFTSQVYELSPHFLHKVWVTYILLLFYNVNSTSLFNTIFIVQEWIMEQWEKNYYISSIAGSNDGSSLVVMSKG